MKIKYINIIGILLALAALVVSLMALFDFSGVPHPVRDRLSQVLLIFSISWNVLLIMRHQKSKKPPALGKSHAEGEKE